MATGECEMVGAWERSGGSKGEDEVWDEAVVRLVRRRLLGAPARASNILTRPTLT